jgi:hypothetical protein
MLRRTFTLAMPALIGLTALGRAQTAGFTPLFNTRDFEGFDRVGDANWRIEDGMAVADRGNGFLVTRSNFADFHLRTEMWIDTATNSGIFIRATDPATITSANAYEVNMWDERPVQRYGTGAIVDIAAVDPMPRAGGRWSTLEITAQRDTFTVVLNGQKTVDGARDGKHATGRIALQHGEGIRDAAGVINDRGVVRFRRVEIRTL